jgi:prephenate dehydrogenase
MNQPPPFDPKKIQEQNQKTIVQDIQRLYKLAGELKDEVEKTDSTKTLSLPMIQKAKEVEKLAKQIASLAAG